MSTEQAVALRVSKPSILLSCLMIIFGLLAVTLPMVSSVGVALLIGWLILFDGVAQLIHAFRSKDVGHILWKLLVAAVYVGAGFYLIVHPLLGLAGLTLVLAIFFFAEGVVDIIAYFSTRKMGASGWILVDGIVTLLLAVLIWRHWPSSSLWVVGTLLGISMLMTGTTRLMMALAVRKLAKDLGTQPPELRAA